MDLGERGGAFAYFVPAPGAPRAHTHTHTTHARRQTHNARARTHTDAHNARTRTHTHKHKHTHIHLHSRTHASTHARTHTRARAHTHTHTHTHTVCRERGSAAHRPSSRVFRLHAGSAQYQRGALRAAHPGQGRKSGPGAWSGSHQGKTKRSFAACTGELNTRRAERARRLDRKSTRKDAAYTGEQSAPRIAGRVAEAGPVPGARGGGGGGGGGLDPSPARRQG